MEKPFGEHPLAGKFNHLTPDQVFDAVESGGRRCTGRFIILNSYENRVYQLEFDDETMVVGKFYRPGRWSRDTILAEHRFLAELAAVEIPVACPMVLEDGETLGEVDGIYYAIFPRVGGRSPDELSDEQVRMMGRLLGRIHNVGAQEEEKHRTTLNPASYGAANLEFMLEYGMIDPDAEAAYKATVEALLERIGPMFNHCQNIRLHGDCHRGNLILTPEGPTFLDFDDMVMGPAVQDIWMMIPSYDAEGARQREILLDGYEAFRSFNRFELQLVEPLRALRFIHYSAWICRRWEDPTFKRTFSHFGTLLYWQKEIQDLREQIARIDAAHQEAW